MTEQGRLQMAKILAVGGLIFWLAYVSKYVFGAPLFLAAPTGNALGMQIGFGLYGYLVLLLGVFLGSIYQELRAIKATNRRRIRIGPTIRNAFRTPDFWLGIFASPVVYAVLLQAIDLEDLSASGIAGLTLVGLQNGFVCNTIAESIVNRTGQGATGAAQPAGK